MTRAHFTTRQREALYVSECERARQAGRGDLPICRLCDLPIAPGSSWDESHQAHKPRWLGGVVDGIAHTRCNRIWNNHHDTPLFARNERIRKRHLDLKRSANPLPGGRGDRLKKKVSGEVVVR